MTRLSDADRDRLAELLREHYALGRLTIEELRRRVEVVLAAEHSAEAFPALEGLPPVAATGDAEVKRRRGRHAQVTAPQPGWLATPERFRDPSTGQIMRVWIDPADHSRHYIPDSDP